MTNEKLYEVLGDINEEYIAKAGECRKRKKAARIKWAVLAACLCLAVGITVPMISHQPDDEPTNDTASPADGPASLVVDGIKYLISPHIEITETLPDGFVKAGEADVGGFKECPYFTNSDIPEWIYVYQEVATDGTVDVTGTLNQAEPHNAYVRYVDVRLRGKDIICYNGEYYISMWSATYYGSSPDVNKEYYSNIKDTYGVRIEGDTPEGFASAGVAEFSGYDTVPQGSLASNSGAFEVYVNPDEPEVIFASTQWYTAPIDESGEVNHKGFNVYIRYDCPFRTEP